MLEIKTLMNIQFMDKHNNEIHEYWNSTKIDETPVGHQTQINDSFNRRDTFRLYLLEYLIRNTFFNKWSRFIITKF